jgi:hypothetical protein
MMTAEMADLVESLRYLVARPGTFEQFYPETTDDALISCLCDGLAEAHLEGLLMAYDCDENGIVSPALSSGRAAVVVLFAGLRFIRSELLNRSEAVVYKAGSAVYEATQSTNILRDIMKALQAQKDRIVAKFADGGTGGSSAFYMADQYLARVRCDGYDLPGW